MGWGVVLGMQLNPTPLLDRQTSLICMTILDHLLSMWASEVLPVHRLPRTDSDLSLLVPLSQMCLGETPPTPPCIPHPQCMVIHQLQDQDLDPCPLLSRRR